MYHGIIIIVQYCDLIVIILYHGIIIIVQYCDLIVIILYHGIIIIVQCCDLSVIILYHLRSLSLYSIVVALSLSCVMVSMTGPEPSML